MNDNFNKSKLKYLALILVLLRRSANNINLWGAEAKHVVNWDVLHGAVSRVDLNVTLVREEIINRRCVWHLDVAQSKATTLWVFKRVTTSEVRNQDIKCFIRKINCQHHFVSRGSTSCMRFLRKMVFCRRGSWTRPSEKKIMPWGKLCCESHDTTRCFCMSGRPVM